MAPFSFVDVSVFLFYFFLGTIFLLIYSHKKVAKEDQRAFLIGYLFKTIYSVLYCALIKFYYHSGDSLLYFRYSRYINELGENPIFGTLGFLIHTNINDLRQEGGFKYRGSDLYLLLPHFVFMIKVTALINLFTFKSFLTTSWVYSLFVFFGSWKFYKVILKYLKMNFSWFLAIIILLFPSFGMWTSGILKDTVVAACLSFYLVGFIHIIQGYPNKIRNLTICLVSLLIISQVKAYVSWALLGSLVFFYLAKLLLSISNRIMRYSLLAFISLLSLAVLAIFSNIILDYINEFIAESFINKALEQGQRIVKEGPKKDVSISTYNLGVDITNDEVNLSTILKLIPNSIITTFYRPFIWEAKEPLVFLAALENTVGFTIGFYLIIKSGILKFFRTLFSRPFFIYLLVFILVFAFLIGISSGNFGTLSRYRTPCIILYYSLIYVIFSLITRGNSKNNELLN